MWSTSVKGRVVAMGTRQEVVHPVWKGFVSCPRAAASLPFDFTAKCLCNLQLPHQ